MRRLCVAASRHPDPDHPGSRAAPTTAKFRFTDFNADAIRITAQASSSVCASGPRADARVPDGIGATRRPSPQFRCLLRDHCKYNVGVLAKPRGYEKRSSRPPASALQQHDCALHSASDVDDAARSTTTTRPGEQSVPL